jgi:hypothetical protein
MTHHLPAQQPHPARPTPAPHNQQMADSIAANLRQSAQLKNFDIAIAYRDGTAELAGSVDNQPQREEVLRVVQGVPGVERVVDRITLVSGQQPPAPPVLRDPSPAGQPPAAPPTPPLLREPTPVTPTPPAGGGSSGPIQEPQPIFQAPPLGYTDLNPPKMPPYAWPTYAPYNNYSRVAYPLAYPYQAWPFIGPIYPYPKVPLGWRCVKLEWDDGYWWFSKLATKHDWWRLRYW